MEESEEGMGQDEVSSDPTTVNVEPPNPHKLYWYEDDDGDRPPNLIMRLMCKCDENKPLWQRWRYTPYEGDEFKEMIAEIVRGAHYG